MQAPPLTHHDIIRRAAPLTRSGLKVNLGACDRTERYIEFEAQTGHAPSVTVIYTLEVDEDDQQLLGRVVVHDSGLVSTLTTTANDLENAMQALQQIPLSRQIRINDQHIAAYSYLVQLEIKKDQKSVSEKLLFVCAQVAGIELRIDVSTGGGMPADVRLLVRGKASNYLRETLADGGILPLDHRAARRLRQDALTAPTNYIKPELPDDVLAVLGPQWRPIRYQGDHWKGVLRLLHKQEKRTLTAERFTEDALHHLYTTLSSNPEDYHPMHSKARWQVHARRLQPVMVFIGILALMPISWLFVSSGAMTIHPLALGLTPLLMVGVVVLTAREIPVMELPARPGPLKPTAWHAADVHTLKTTSAHDHENYQAKVSLHDPS